MAASAPGNEGFSIDLFSNSLHDPVAVFRPSSIPTVRVDHDSAGMLAVHLPPNSCRSLHFGFLSGHLGNRPKKPSKTKNHGPDELPSKEIKKEPSGDDGCVKEIHSVLRKGHRAIFDEQVGCFLL